MTNYWFSDFSSLFNSININPFVGGNKNFKYNSLTRLIVLVTVICSIIFNNNIGEILIAGFISLSLSVIIYLYTYNSQEPYNSQERATNSAANSYEGATKIISEQSQNLTTDSTQISEKIVQDYNQNVKNQVSISYSPVNTEKLKQIAFLEGDKSSNVVNYIPLKSYEYLQTGPKVQYGTTKRLLSLLEKNVIM